MEQILLACRDGILNGLIEPVLVIASKDNIGGIQRAKDAKFPVGRIYVCDRRQFRSNKKFGQALLNLFDNHGVDLIGLYGCLCKIPANVIERYLNWIINQHPGGLDTGYPDFGGPGMYEQRVHHTVLKYYQYLVSIGEKQWPQYTEATTHRVTKEYDKGKIIGRMQVEIFPNDTVDSLQKRVLPFEHQLQIDVLRQIATGTVQELERDDRLIDPWRTGLLDQFKAEAIAAYPHG